MSLEENKRIVAEGLQQKKAARLAAEHEAQLDRYEQAQIRAINENCAGARLNREAEQSRMLQYQQRIARRNARVAELAEAQRKEDAAMAACRYYGLACLAVLWLAAVTRFPFWTAVAMIAGLAVFPAAYIFRLYFPPGGLSHGKMQRL